MLKRTQMYLPEEVLNRLKRKSKKEKTTVSGIVRDALAEYLAKEETKDWRHDALWEIVGRVSSGKKDLSAKHDEYLYGKQR